MSLLLVMCKTGESWSVLETAYCVASMASSERRCGLSSKKKGRSAFGLLTDRNFSLYFFGRLSSHCAIWVQNVVSTIVVYGLTGSATMAGAVSVLQFLPQVLLSAWAGALSDRVDRRRLLMLGRTPAAIGTTLLGSWGVLEGGGELQAVWPVLATSFVSGFGWALSVPAGHALVPSLVPARDLDGAVALHALCGNVARMAGPAAAGFILLAAGPEVAFLASGVGHWLFVLALMLIRPLASIVARDPGEDGSVREGLRYVRANRRLVILLISGACVGVAIDPILTLAPALARELDGGDSLVSAMASTFGAGAVSSILLLGHIRARIGLARLSTRGLALLGAGLLAVGMTSSTHLVLVWLFVAGVGGMLATSSLAIRIQRIVADTYRGRVMALWGIAFLGSRPFAALLNGLVADTFSVRVALFVAAGFALAAGWLNIRTHSGGEDATEIRAS